MAGAPTPSFVILGGGPAGLAAAYKLSQRGFRNVTVLERASKVGGNAGSFVIEGIPVDFGSHRLHPVCPPDVMADIRSLVGQDLLDRPRHGRIRLRGRWVHFPLKPVDLLTRLPPAFMTGVMADAIRKPFTGAPAVETFASILERGLGRTICRDFYFPYARKIWGLAPEALDPEQAKRRVSSGSIGKMVRRVLGAVPGLKKPGAGRFFYPKHGYGQISDALHRAAVESGAAVHLDTNVTDVVLENGRVSHVQATVGGASRRLAATHVLSTIPVTVLARLVRTTGGGPPEAATDSLAQRAMVLIYLTLESDQFTEFDAHYFPETVIRISRLSEPKNYSLTSRPGRTVLCAELPCAQSDDVWGMTDEALGALVVRDLETAGLAPVPRVLHVQTKRLPHAYPLYTRGYRESFDALDRWIGGIDGLTTFGRQGLFAHDNTHHTMAMAYALVSSLGPDGSLDRDAWARARKSFEEHVVED
ncbi:MAG TPA: FAD-dependent oxidoreductase [Vicinamibacterales bacterium]|nr:FAD-dependent oxidoreductase [Vicinamibacterales bacterium]